MVTHGAASDAFCRQIQTGAQEAADKDNVDFKYSGSGEVPEQSTFIQNAIDSKVDGIAVILPDPDALGPVVQKASRRRHSGRRVQRRRPGLAEVPAHWPSSANPRCWPASSPATS